MCIYIYIYALLLQRIISLSIYVYIYIYSIIKVYLEYHNVVYIRLPSPTTRSSARPARFTRGRPGLAGLSDPMK